MGLLIIGAFITCLVVTRLIGMVALTAHSFCERRGYGSWRAFSAVGFVVSGLLVVLAAWLWVPMLWHSGAPSDEDFTHSILAWAAIGTAIGLAVTSREARQRLEVARTR